MADRRTRSKTRHNGSKRADSSAQHRPQVNAGREYRKAHGAAAHAADTPSSEASSAQSESVPMSDTEREVREKVSKRAARREKKMAAKEAKRRAKDNGEPGAVRKAINGWTDRVLGAAKGGGLGKQEAEYASHRTTADYIWNTAGLASYGVVFPLLTIVVTQLCGADQAGRFSLAFVAGQLLVIVANYGIRTYQVSDVKEVRSFSEYQVNRWLTCIGMLLIGYLYCCIRGYTGEMFTMFIWVFVYRMIDGLADVYEGRLQQMDKLYLAGISQAVRSVLAFLACTIVLLITKDLGIASIAMGIAAIASFVIFTYPLALLETPKSRRMTFGGVARLFKDGFPVFLALFLYAFIDNMPKFVMEGVLTYDNQLYFNALYFPAQAILMIVGFIYKPMLVRIANAWADPSRRRRFDLFVVLMILVIAVITAINIFIMWWIGIPILSFLYGIDFEQFRTMSYIMLVAGGVTGVIDFLYQVITVMRHQRDVMKLYLMTFAFSLFVPYLMVSTAGLNGAVDGYLIMMSFLAALLLMEYITVRISYSRHPEKDPDYLEGSPLESKSTHKVRKGQEARSAVAHQGSGASSQPPSTGQHGPQGQEWVAFEDEGAASPTVSESRRPASEPTRAARSQQFDGNGEKEASSVRPSVTGEPRQAQRPQRALDLPTVERRHPSDAADDPWDESEYDRDASELQPPDNEGGTHPHNEGGGR
ncbi:MAG: lipopolysaccharide biosynthesis protein [Eggerthellaceae bacterium]|jgi:O-antigen/teichoic acid export membrane protein